MSRGVRRAAAVAVALALGAAGWSAVRQVRDVATEFHPWRGAVTWPADVAAWPGRTDVAFDSAAGDRLRGWFVGPHDGGGAVVLVHGTQADRRQLLAEGSALVAAGLGVLAYDGPGCGESGGEVTWGRSERSALEAAVRFAAAQAGVRAVGVLGFSQGAYVAAQVAPGDLAVRALAIEGTPAALVEQTRYEYRHPAWLFGLPAVAARFRGGWRPDAPEPREAISGLAPRALLVVQGDADPVVPPGHGPVMAAAAGAPDALWLIHGAGHGGYARAEPAAYPARLVAFFRTALAVPAPPGAGPR